MRRDILEMTYMIYGVVKEPVVVDPPMTGLRGRKVSFVTGHGLCAAVSEITDAEGMPPASELLTYSRVVDNLHHLQAVIPMRYGCFFSGIEMIQNVLKMRRRQYETLLAQLAGHVEMGIRLLPQENGRLLRQEPAMNGRDISSLGEKAARREDEQSIDGAAYLALRKIHYHVLDDTLLVRRMLVDQCIQAFSGLFAGHRTETDIKNGTVVISLYFLTPANKVDCFRRIFGQVVANGDTKALLSGPWPPYNFVTLDLASQ